MKKMYESTKFISAFISYIKVADVPVRRAIAEEPNTPVEVLEFLSKDEEPSVRLSVAKNPNTPVESLELLATDESGRVRKNVAENPNISDDIV